MSLTIWGRIDIAASVAQPVGMIAAQIVQDIIKNIAMGIPSVRRRRVANGRTALAPDASLLPRYVDALLAPVAATGNIRDKAVLEIGPGDNLVTGLAFLNQGAGRYTAIDRFPGPYGNAAAQEWYRLLAERDGADVSDFPRDSRVTTIKGGVEDLETVGSFDIVCSLAVGEHVRNVPDFARFTGNCLKRGGVAVHVVDFSGHHWHRDDDPDLFRRFPNWLWRAMGSNRGLPNRVPPIGFERAFANTGLRVETVKDGATAVFVLRHAHCAFNDGKVERDGLAQRTY